MINYKEIPKIELHCHLDGSLRPETVAEELNRDVKEVTYEMIAPKKCEDLNDYLTRFDIPVSVLQSRKNLSRAAYELANDLRNDKVIYAEIRFAPVKHTKEGLTTYEVVDSILAGLSSVDIKTNLILCMMRGDSYDENMSVIDTAKHYLGKGVCAIDLAGAEAIYKTSDYKDYFEYAKKLEVPFTIHAGEADGKDSIRSAIEFGTSRIGHGVRILEDPSLIELVKEKDILLEVCPTSNIQTNAFDKYIHHPAKKMYDAGIKISINTDNRTVSNTTLNREYNLIVDNLGFTYDELIEMNRNAIKHAFLSNDEKQKLLNKYNSLI